MKVFVLIAAALGLAVPAAAAPARAAKVCADCVTETMRHLADPKMRGRACGTADENAAARYLADRLKRYRVKGAAPGGGYLQAVTFRTPTYASPPSLAVGGLTLTQGREIVTLDPADSVEAPLVRVGLAAPEAAAGKMALYDAPYDPKAVGVFLRAGAAAVIAPAPESVLRAWDQLAERGPRGVQILGVEEAPVPAQPRGPTVIFARPEALAQLRALEGQVARLAAPRGAPVERTTYNVLAAIPGRTKAGRAQEAVLLSAHYDHVGVRGGVVYPGANDDASGTAAVVEFARMLASGRAPKRTVQFALFGCEEEGGHGARYFLAHPPVPLSTLVANLEFEMIGVPDPKDRKALMLTGWERTDLGPALRAQGASLVPDRYPEQNFFQRSDNYQLARKGVVAQTISAWPIPPTYHQPTDTLENLDLTLMVEVIQSLAGPIRWLIDGEFRPAWGPGMQP